MHVPHSDPDRVAVLRRYIDSILDVRPGNKVQANHPSFSYYLPDGPSPEEIFERFAHRATRHRSLYVSYPYCIPTAPGDCGFCLFPKVDLSGGTRAASNRYLDHLRRHAEALTKHTSGLPIDSVYFGGGTPNLLPTDLCVELVALVRNAFELDAKAELTYEGIPQLYADEEKVAALRDAGVTRISIGAQQLKDELIRHSGRKQKKHHVQRSIEFAKKYGLGFSIDLIFGWPGQTYEDAIDDIRQALDWGVPHLTVYPLNVVKDATPFSRDPFRAMLPGVPECRRMYRGIRDVLLAAGYQQVTMSDYERSTDCASDYQYECDNHDPIRCDALAIGYSAFSRLGGTYREPGAAFLTPHSLGRYFEDLDGGRLPFRASFRYTPEDVLANYVCSQLQQKRVRLDDFEDIFGTSFVERYADEIEAFVEVGWAELDEEEFRLVDLGVFYTAPVQRILTRARVDELRANRKLVGYKSTATLGASEGSRP